MAELQADRTKKHSITVDERKLARISGVYEVNGYDLNTVIAQCGESRLVIRGEALRIDSFDQATGELRLQGKIEAMQYIEEKPKTGSFLARLLK